MNKAQILGQVHLAAPPIRGMDRWLDLPGNDDEEPGLVSLGEDHVSGWKLDQLQLGG
jgi:hypothetical protein